ncbi:uncharacterized protein B0T15DRAFT_490765 [Chaetomium strumarium]|uniref:F-box domain-containing protein n=1 Tax=Chaetomium strumarium TaxID=1170767 RepID=A0AAJ0GYN2_9PEZI|nr:hypothetical protein B0T15DRAFT_490765 [Chaetomium strumarium]
MTTREPRRTDGLRFLTRSGPAELILRILQYCHSTRDVLALVSTCRHVCDVWRGNVAAAVWPVWLREIPHFQDALTAIRTSERSLEAQDDVFGPIAEWLLDSILADKESRQAMADRFEQGYGRAEYCLTHPRLPDGCSPCIAKPLADGRGSHSDAHLVVWELMKMFWLVEQVRPHALDQWILDRDAPRPPSTQSEGVGTDKNNGGRLELTVAVFFGMFGAEETLLLTSRADSLDGPDGPWRRLITRPAVPETNGKGTPRDGMPPNIMSVAVLFNYIFNHSGRPNHIGWTDEPVAALEFKFFEYFLQRHLELCLDCQPFREDGFEFEYGSLQEFIVTIAIFSHDDVESRNSHCFWNWKARLEEADFLDGSERLTTYPPDFTRYYEERFQ